MVDEINEAFDISFLANTLPARKWLPWGYVFPRIKQLTKMFAYFHKQNRQYVSEHKKSFNAEHVRDILDALLVQQKKMDAEGESVKFTDKHAAAIIFDIALGNNQHEANFFKYL